MATYSNFIDFTQEMRIPGVPDTNQFCVDQKNLTAFISDRSTSSFIVIDLIQGKRIAQLRREPFKLMKGKLILSENLRFVEHISRTIVLALFLEFDTKRYFAVLFELKIEENIVLPIDEHYIGIQQISSDDSSDIVKDENDEIYCVVHWQNEQQRKTAFHIAQLKIDDTLKISHQILAQNLKLYNLYYYPIIFKNSIILFLDKSERKRIVAVYFDKDDIKQYSAISAHQCTSTDEQYPPNGISSITFVFNSTAYSYIFNREKRTGELWTLDLNLRKWHKCFELHTHVISSGAIFVTSHRRLYLHGQCSDESCSEKAHLYHFGVYFCGKMIFPTIDQLVALFCTKKTQFIHGQKQSGKSFVLLLKAMKAIEASSNSATIKIFVANNEQRNYFFQNFGASFDSENIFLFTKTNMRDEKFANCEIFVDGLSSLYFEQKQFFLNRKAKSTVTFDEQVSFQSGFEHPRSYDISWHQVSHQFESGAEVLSIVSYKTERPNGNMTAVNMEHFIQQSMEAMDHFYDRWWSPSLEKETICIPACHDVFNNRYMGPSCSNANDFDPKIFKKKKNLYRGQKAERDLLKLIQRCQIGGIYVTGFNSLEFAKSQKSHKKFKNSGISDFEIDGIFMHPLLGIFVFEVKATEQSNYLKTIKTALDQLNKIKEQLSIIIQNICNAKFTIPICFSLCFPNAIIPNNKKRNSFYYFDKSSFRDETELKSMFLKNFIPQDELVSTSLKIFTAAVAGYRSLDFLSAGHNALAVHKMIDKQIFMKSLVKNDLVDDGIFFTSEQLVVIDCPDQHQIISGPPGTGKTLLLLKKALASAQIMKEGIVYVLTRSPELNFKFQIFFEQHRKSIVRFPFVHLGFKNIKKYLDNDDIFADEFNFYHIPLLQQRLKIKTRKQSGQTVIVFTGLFHPLAVNNMNIILNKHNLTGYSHFLMNTVVRSSKEIFDEWNKEFVRNNYSIHLGHNINGPKIIRIKLENSNEILEETLKIIQDLFLTHKSDERADNISLGSLCIITDNDESCSLIKSFLSCHQIPCGSIEEQIDNRNIVAVTVHTKTVSHEWPIVILVAMIDIAFSERFFLLASSRCIAKLVIIERDFLSIMRKLDHLTESMIRGSLLNVSFNLFFKLIRGEAEKNGETEWFVQYHDVVSQTLRWNIFFSEMKRVTEFKNCQALCDCWQIIADRPILCRAVLHNKKDLRRDLERIETEMILLPDKPTRFFARITSVHSTAEYQVRIWEISKQLVQALIDIVRKESSGIRSNKKEIEEELRIADQLDRAGDAWKYLSKPIKYLF